MDGNENPPIVNAPEEAATLNEPSGAKLNCWSVINCAEVVLSTTPDMDNCAPEPTPTPPFVNVTLRLPPPGAEIVKMPNVNGVIVRPAFNPIVPAGLTVNPTFVVTNGNPLNAPPLKTPVTVSVVVNTLPARVLVNLAEAPAPTCVNDVPLTDDALLNVPVQVKVPSLAMPPTMLTALFRLGTVSKALKFVTDQMLFVRPSWN